MFLQLTVSQLWCQVYTGASDHIFVAMRMIKLFFLTRRWVCPLKEVSFRINGLRSYKRIKYYKVLTYYEQQETYK
jgi:hypothetical protein